MGDDTPVIDVCQVVAPSKRGRERAREGERGCVSESERHYHTLTQTYACMHRARSPRRRYALPVSPCLSVPL